MARIIGLTGGIGSGKTTVAKQFEQFGVPVYVADDAGRTVLQQAETIEMIRRQFGDCVLEGGQVDRAALGTLVFNDKQLLQKLNNIVHPRVALHFRRWLGLLPPTSYIIKEAAILFESGSYKECDKIITVVADIETRIARVMQRDGVDRMSVEHRMNNQWTDAQRIAHSDYIIKNNSLAETYSQVAVLHAKLLNLQ